MSSNKNLKYIILLLLNVGILLSGCKKTEEVTVEISNVTQEEAEYALPEVGEAAIMETETPKASKGTITVATVGNPNVEILQEASRILEEKGYGLKIEICEDYLTPNQMVAEGKADCNYYQHAAFLERYNIEKQTNLVEMAKIHYEPMAIFSKKLESLENVGKGAKVIIPENPTALAQALWLLQAEGLLTLMSDADMNTVLDDIAENPYGLDILPMNEDEILAKINEADLVLCHRGYALKAGLEAEEIMLAMEQKDSMMAQNLAQTIVVSQYPNENASLLVEVLMSEEMEKFMGTQYLGSIYKMDGELADIETTIEEASKEAETETTGETEQVESEEKAE